MLLGVVRKRGGACLVIGTAIQRRMIKLSTVKQAISVDWSIKLIHHSKRQPEPINSYPTLKIRL